uniref:Nodule Cysteine-Rich (NCR) secreted peptide n=1 Tax=Ditylenchus dipsaci TaxID=166011 RepID=A0A915EWC1_9BILA
MTVNLFYREECLLDTSCSLLFLFIFFNETFQAKSDVEGETGKPCYKDEECPNGFHCQMIYGYGVETASQDKYIMQI